MLSIEQSEIKRIPPLRCGMEMQKKLRVAMKKSCGMEMQTGAWVKGRREDQAGFGRESERL